MSRSGHHDLEGRHDPTQLCHCRNASFALISTSAFAQEVDEQGRTVVYKSKTEIDFEGLEMTVSWSNRKALCF